VIYDTILVADAPIGSNPLQPRSPRILSIGWADGNHAQITGSGDAGVTYRIQASSDLLTWNDIGRAAAQSGGGFSFDDPQAANAAARFYRVATP